MGQAFSYMDIIFVLVGLYILYAGYQMKFHGKIATGVLLPKDVNLKKCKDKEAYINEMFPKTMLYGFVVTVWGAVSFANDKYGFLQKGYFLLVVLLLAVTVWFMLTTKKAYEKYWPQVVAKKDTKSAKKK